MSWLWQPVEAAANTEAPVTPTEPSTGSRPRTPPRIVAPQPLTDDDEVALLLAAFVASMEA